jgi:5-methylcytosine-specific restriction protein A
VSTPDSGEFRTVLEARLALAEREAKHFIDIEAGGLHREVGGYPARNHRMPLCCQVMRQAMNDRDRILAEPKKGQGASLKIRYALPR